jgi:hypothetical protein
MKARERPDWHWRRERKVGCQDDGELKIKLE